MRRISESEIKQIEINILEEFKLYCESNGLRYFLAYGTLIGAVRHQGFIPWDDDIDVMMPREDYNILIRDYNKMTASTYELIDPICNRARHPYVKLTDKRTVKIESGVDYSNGTIGIDIDIFPIDGQPTTDEEFKKWKKKLIKYYTLHYYYILDLKQDPLKNKIVVPMLRHLIGGKNAVLLKSDKLHAEYPFETSKYLGVLESIYVDEGDRVPRECYEGFVLAEFEGKEYRIPKGFDLILKKIYGDYMVLPPVEKRVTNHTNVCYWIE